MKRKSLALLLAVSMFFANSAGVFAVDSDFDTYDDNVEILETEDNYEDIVITDEADAENSEVPIEEADVENSEAIEDEAPESTSGTSTSEDATVYDKDIPPLTYRDIELERPFENPDLSLDASYNSNSDYTAEKYITPSLPALRSQSPYGSCWAHASMALAEISLITKGIETTDVNYSEVQLAYFSYNSVTDPLGGTEGDSNSCTDPTNFMGVGGNLIFSQNVLASWVGAADEALVPYSFAAQVIKDLKETGKGLDDSVAYDDAAHMTHYYDLTMPNYYLYDDKDNPKVNPNFNDQFAPVKKLIVDLGAVGISYNSKTEYTNSEGKSIDCFNEENNAFYRPDSINTNHAVVIVGWDDNFSSSNFNVTPQGDGAWLVRNSWYSGTNQGKEGDEYCLNGYFWLSYYDSSLSESAYGFDFEKGSSYDHNYQYDGAMYSTSVSVNKVANIFTVQGGGEAEILRAVSFVTTGADQNYNFEIYTDLMDDNDPTAGQLAATLTGTTSYEGYYTIPLDEEVGLSEGSKFAVVLKLTNSDNSGASYKAENGGQSWFDIRTAAKSGQSYYYNGSEWKDYGAVNNKNWRIKAFTNDASAVEPTGITFAENDYSVEVGDYINPVVKVSPLRATNRQYTLESSDSSIVKVVNGVKLQGVKAGTATITAKTVSGNLSATATVKVTRDFSFEIKGATYLNKNGKEATYTVATYPSDVELTDEVVFSSSDTTIISIDSKTGVARGVGVGSTYVTASIGKKSSSIYVFVSPAEPVVTYEVARDNTITLTWQHAEGTEYYSVDDEDVVLDDNVQPDSSNTCTYIDDRYSGKKINEDTYVLYNVTAYEKNGKTVTGVQVLLKAGSASYNIKYNLDGGTNDERNPEYYTENTATIKLKNATKEGNIFNGWYENPDFTKKITSIVKGRTGDITLYAKWTPITYTLRFAAGGATGGKTADKKKCGYYDKIELPACGYTRKGYEFIGWSTDKTEEGMLYYPGDYVSQLGTKKGQIVKLYAKWKIVDYSIKYELNGADTDPENEKVYTVATKTFKLKAPTRAGYIFKGWYKNYDAEKNTYKGKVTKIAKGSKGDLTLHAKWAEIKYTIKFNGNKATTGKMAKITGFASEKVTLPANVFEKKGYVFTGWKCKVKGQEIFLSDMEELYKPEFITKSGQTITLYAQWKIEE